MCSGTYKQTIRIVMELFICEIEDIGFLFIRNRDTLKVVIFCMQVWKILLPHFSRKLLWWTLLDLKTGIM